MEFVFIDSMIRYLCPKQVIEVGSGMSSCLILDTQEIFLSNETKVTFIEPYPDLLKSKLKSKDLARHRLLSQRLQDTPVAEFEKLEKNDILFIDSSHVSKTGSDINYLFFEILPKLKDGVYIHFHDIFYPFEYPEDWIQEERAWNEAYLLRSFLQFNSQFKIVFFNTFLQFFYEEEFSKYMPNCLLNRGGSIWIQKHKSAFSI